MGDRPLIVVLLSVPVRCILTVKRILGKLFGDLLVLVLYSLYSLLRAFELRDSVSKLLLSALIRSAILAFMVYFVYLALQWWLYVCLVQQKVPLSVTLTTSLILILTTISIVQKRVSAHEIPDFRPLISLTLLDFSSLLLTIVPST